MKKYIKILTIFLVITLMQSCSDSFLDEEVRSSYSPETLNDKLGFEASLIGLYQQISNFYIYNDWQGWLCIWQDGTDIVWPTQPQGIEVPFYQYELLTSDNPAVLRTWTLMYNIVENSNGIIANVAEPDISDMTDEEELDVEAEARFFRALAYNYLATLWGDVPLVKEQLTQPKTDFVRTPVGEVNTFIEEDLLFAVENLPPVDEQPQEARVNTYVAAQLLAKVYLRVGLPGKAEEQCDYIINSGEYKLITGRYGVHADEPGDHFSDMFFVGNLRRSQGNTEAIWVLEQENPTDVRGGSPGFPQQRRVWGAAYHNRAGMLPADSLGGRGIARMRLNNWVLYGLYDDGDIRNSKYNIRRAFYYNDPAHELYGQKVPYEGPDTLFIIAPYTTKWKQFDSRDTFGFGLWKDFMLMRLGETYLLRAEARLLQEDPDGAAADINVLRDRANAPDVDPADMDMDFILDERVRELLAEENRRMELMRTGMLVERATSFRQNGTPETMVTTGLSETHLLFPIPLTEIQLNKDADLGQNEGYTN